MANIGYRFSLTVVLLALSCRTLTPGSQLDAVPLDATEVRDEVVRYASVRDTEFCQGRPAGQCFLLFIGVPAPQLEKNFTLNTLAMALGAEKFRLPLLRACQKGLDAYVLGHQGLQKTLRNKMFSKIKETRCVFDYIVRETYELPELPEGQFAVATRLANWDVKGGTKQLGIVPLVLEISSANLEMSYRDSMIYSRPQGESKSRWSPFLSKDFRPLGGFTPLATRGFNLKFSGSVRARFADMDTVEALAVVLEYIRSSDITRDSLRFFFTEAAATVRGFMHGGGGQTSLALVGLGIDAIHSLKPEDIKKLQLASMEVVKGIRGNLGDGEVVDSATNAIFADSHQYLPSKFLDDVFWNSHGEQLGKTLGVEESHPEN